MRDNDHRHSQGNSGASNLMAGLVIGAALTYLFGTENGRKLKDELVKEAQKILASIEEKGKEVKEEIQENPQIIEQKIVETAQNVEAVTQAVVEQVAEVPQHIAEVQKKGRRFFFHKSHHPTES